MIFPFILFLCPLPFVHCHFPRLSNFCATNRKWSTGELKYNSPERRTFIGNFLHIALDLFKTIHKSSPTEINNFKISQLKLILRKPWNFDYVILSRKVRIGDVRSVIPKTEGTLRCEILCKVWCATITRIVHRRNRLICDQSNSYRFFWCTKIWVCSSGSLIQIQITPKERTKIVITSR